MNSEPQTGQKSPLKKALLYSSLLILMVALYTGYVLLNRHESTVQFEKRAAAQQAEKLREDDRRAIDQLGGSELSIRALYVSPDLVAPGEAAQLCYDVANAKTVALYPPACRSLAIPLPLHRTQNQKKRPPTP